MIDIAAPLDLQDAGAGAFLDDLQGNILRAHARDHAAPGRPPIPLASEKSHGIARRGMPYGSGDYLTGAAPPPTGGVGLYFMAAQRNLQNFELQQAGCDNNDFVPVGVGVDATIGRVADPAPQTFIRPLGVGATTDPFVRLTFANFVTLRGGEYFFLPSMGFFRTLNVG
jgi:hypothetical protein